MLLLVISAVPPPNPRLQPHHIVHTMLTTLHTQPLAEKILEYQPDSTDPLVSLPSEIAEAIHQLWKDPIVTKIMDEHSSEFYLMDSAP